MREFLIRKRNERKTEKFYLEKRQQRIKSKK